ncbi:T9SS type A sorting domain-containing protein [Flavobacterium sp.]|uniref:Ig-like domain-containing protein n=1 Tax=Flavobacterium sp. TaxID=239 RepID=UPI00260FE514|nr:T9SS type A sorting domain-containing protein [Flavobacterium sp.]
MKTTKIYLVVCLTFILTQFNAFAQYNGGNSNGSTANELSNTSCTIPAHFYAYFGGNNDGSSVEELSTTSCGTAAFQFAYMGGTSDGAATEELSSTVCGIPPSFFAYMGGNNDGAGVETFEANVCAFPPQFYAYFGGNGDGFTLDKTAPICPTEPPVASFTASLTEICVGQTVTFTDTSTNIPSAWTWTFEGGTSATSTIQNPVITYNTPGVYDVTLMAANYNGTNTVVATDQIIVYAYPIITSTTPVSRCDSGTLTLQASTNVGTLNWYDAATGGTLVGTGTSFTTPSLSSTTTYYVESLNGVCSSSRSAVVATVNTTPTITSTTPATRCGSGSVTISATASAGTILWYDASTAGTLLASGTSFSPNVAITTTYYVETTLNGCTSPRIAVVVTVNTTPTITGTTPASRCDAGTVTLQATASSGTLNWYDAPTAGNLVGTGTSFTTPSISVSTTYYVEASNGSCTSARTAVTATVNVTPSITSTTPGSRCDSGSITLFASANAGTLNWYNAPSGGTLVGTGTSFTTPSISTTTTYYVEAVNGSCTSVRTSVVATVNASPTITGTTPASICSGDSFNISAVASSGTINWYNLPTGGTLLATGSNYSLSSLSVTTIFYAQAIDGSCSSVRTPVEVTVTNRPTNTSSVPASRCGNGSVTLSATFSSGTVNWYDAPVGGTLVGTGSNFTTPSLSATTSYYAEATNGVCTSLVRTSVTATINEIPAITSTTPASRCGDGSVILQATASIGTINWYNAPTGGTLVATGGSFTTPVLGTTTIYYVEVVNGGCNSARTAVNATVFAVATITSTTPASRCDAGSLTLNATSNVGTLSWYDAPSGGTLLGSGTSFITPNISTTTTYYVEANNGVCTTSRVAVTATINPTAAPTGFANQTFCAGETVGLISVTGSNIVWYDAPSSGNVIPSGTTLVSGTTYYASQTVTGCESPTRLAVTMTLGGCLGNEEFVINSIKLFPNPVVDFVTIISTDIMSKIEIINMLGQTVSSQTIKEVETNIDMTRYSSGSYIIRVFVEDKIKTFKVIKK